VKSLCISLVLCCVSSLAFATIERITVTYQPLHNPQVGIQIRPVYFLTYCSSPESEVGALYRKNAILPECSHLDGNSNLASLYQIKTKCVAVAGRDTSATVLLDLSELSNPHELGYAESEIVDSIVECLILVLRGQRYVRMRLTVRPPEAEGTPGYSEYERTYMLQEETRPQIREQK